MKLVLVTTQNISVCTTSFTNIQNIPSKIDIDQKHIRQSVSSRIFNAQSNSVRIQKRYCGTCIYICHFSEQAIGFRTQNFNTSITGFTTSKIVINFQSSIFYCESNILYALHQIFNVQFTKKETKCQRKLFKNQIPK